MAFSFPQLKAISFPVHLKTQLLLSVLSLTLVTLLVLVYYFRVQPEIPLFYTLTEPSNQLVKKEWLFVFPLLSLGMLCSHLVVLNILTRFEKIAVTLFSWMTVITQTLLLLSLLRIIYIIS